MRLIVRFRIGPVLDLDQRDAVDTEARQAGRRALQHGQTEQVPGSNRRAGRDRGRSGRPRRHAGGCGWRRWGSRKGWVRPCPSIGPGGCGFNSLIAMRSDPSSSCRMRRTLRRRWHDPLHGRIIDPCRLSLRRHDHVARPPSDDLFKIEYPIVLAPMAGAIDADLTIGCAKPADSVRCQSRCSPNPRCATRSQNPRPHQKPLNVNFFCHPPPDPNNAREARGATGSSPITRNRHRSAAPVPSSNRTPFDAALCGRRRAAAPGRQLPFRIAGGRSARSG